MTLTRLPRTLWSVRTNTTAGSTTQIFTSRDEARSYQRTLVQAGTTGTSISTRRHPVDTTGTVYTR